MTRINVVPVETLSRQHLVAEYREITRLPSNLRTSLSRKGKPFSMSEIPPEYKLGAGHVKFFMDKMEFLEQRFTQLYAEMIRRGYNPSFMDATIFRDCPTQFYNNYEPTPEAIFLNMERIKERS